MTRRLRAASLVRSQAVDDAVETRNSACLSPRELEVLELAALGLTNQQAATRLKISVHAVKFHLAAIYRKLGAANRTEAVVTYLRAQQPLPAADERT